MLWNAPATADQLKQKEILESFITQTRRRHRDLVAERRLPDRDDQPGDRRGHPGRDLGLRRAEVEARWRSTASTTSPAGGILGEQAVQAAERQGQGRDHHQPGRHQPAAPARRREGSAREGARASRSSRSTTSRRTRSAAPSSSPPARTAIPISPRGSRSAAGRCSPATRSAAIDPAEDQGDLVRHHPARARSAPRRQGQVLLGQKYFGWGSESVKLLYDIKHGKMPASAHHRLRRRRRHEGQRRRVRRQVEEDGERGLDLNIGEIARRAHVSTATVSRTLNQTGTVRPETARKVWRVAAALNYYPNSHARALVSGRSRLLGLIVSDITNPFFPELVHSFEALATAAGLRPDPDEHRLPDRAHDRLRAADARAESGRRRDHDVGDGSRPDQGAGAPRRAAGLHGRRPGRPAHEPRAHRLRPRHPPGGRSPRRSRAQARRLHHRPARPALGAHAAPGVPRRHARASPHAGSEAGARRDPHRGRRPAGDGRDPQEREAPDGGRLLERLDGDRRAARASTPRACGCPRTSRSSASTTSRWPATPGRR